MAWLTRFVAFITPVFIKDGITPMPPHPYLSPIEEFSE
jgi:hypothetical protein